MKDEDDDRFWQAVAGLVWDREEPEPGDCLNPNCEHPFCPEHGDE